MKVHLCPHPTCEAPPRPASAQACDVCGTPLTLNRQYRILRCIGEGGMGKTFLAQDLRFLGLANEHCVLKQLKEAANPQGQGKELLKREASRLLDLRHPGIPAYRDFFDHTFTQGSEAESRFYMVQQYIKGESLQHYLEHNGPMALQELLPLMQRVLEILAYLHQQKDPNTDQPAPLLHLDIKPDNLMLRHKDEAIFLIDFGIATQLAQADIKTQGAKASIHGFTPGFAPFEQTMGYAAPASDLYAWAMTCLVMLTGRSPGELVNPIEQKAMWTNYTSMPSTLEALLQSCLALQVKDRAQRAEEVLLQLQEATGLASVSPHSQGALPSGVHLPVAAPSQTPPLPSSPSSEATLAYSETNTDVGKKGEKGDVEGPEAASPPDDKAPLDSEPLVTGPPSTPPKSQTPQLPPGSPLRSAEEREGEDGAGRWFGLFVLLVAGLVFAAYQSGFFDHWKEHPQPSSQQGQTRSSPDRTLPRRAARRAPVSVQAPTLSSPTHPARVPEKVAMRPVLRRPHTAPTTQPTTQATTKPTTKPTAALPQHRQPPALPREPTRSVPQRPAPPMRAPAHPLPPQKPTRYPTAEERALAILGDPSWFAARHVVQQLRKLPDKSAAKVIKVVLRKGNVIARTRVIKRLNRFKTLSDKLYAQLASIIQEKGRSMQISQMRAAILNVYKTFAYRDDLRAVRALLDQLQHPQWGVRYYALRYLGIFESKHRRKYLPKKLYQRYLAALVHFLDDRVQPLRTDAIRRLSYHGTPAKYVLEKMGALLDDPKRPVRNSARKALIWLARKSPEAWRQLLRGLRHKHKLERRWTTQALERTVVYARKHGLGVEAAKALAPMLSSTDIETVRYAVRALGKLGPDATPMRPRIQALLGTYQTRFTNAKTYQRRYLGRAIKRALKLLQRKEK